MIYLGLNNSIDGLHWLDGSALVLNFWQNLHKKPSIKQMTIDTSWKNKTKETLSVDQIIKSNSQCAALFLKTRHDVTWEPIDCNINFGSAVTFICEKKLYYRYRKIQHQYNFGTSLYKYTCDDPIQTLFNYSALMKHAEHKISFPICMHLSKQDMVGQKYLPSHIQKAFNVKYLKNFNVYKDVTIFLYRFTQRHSIFPNLS